MPAGGRVWSLLFATIGFGLLASGLLGLLALALATLLIASGVARSREGIIAALVAVAGLWFIFWTAADPFDAALGAYSLLVAAAFAGGALVAPTGVSRQGIRAMLWGIAGTGALGLVVRGSRFWSELQWSVVHQTSSAVRMVVERWPDSYPMYEPMVHFFGTAFPGLLALQTMVALLLAWQWHHYLAPAPLGPAVTPFRQFRFADHWVWAIVGVLMVWAIPRLAALKGVALNLGLVLSVLYCLRGAAVIVALATGAGVPVWALTVATVIAVGLVIPLLLLIPGLWTLGVFDTWLAFRQRGVGQSTVR
ncbi:MAG TPA: hypothetical protein VJ816_12045 [Gemmatimonadales bacterium]|nr:hypothetical protein [Gemmatimonadales bacterium]